VHTKLYNAMVEQLK